MVGYFTIGDNLERLRAEISEWEGTPWRHQVAVKGLGCDCIHFVLAVLVNIGAFVLKPGMIPEYPRDWHLHNTRELLFDGIRKHLNVREVGPSSVRGGDLILMHYGKAASHAGFYLDDKIFHCTDPGGVHGAQWGDQTWMKRIRYIMRLLS